MNKDNSEITTNNTNIIIHRPSKSKSLSTSPLRNHPDYIITPSKNSGQSAYTNYQTQNLAQESLRRIIEDYIRYFAAGDNHTARAKRNDLSYFLLFLAGNNPENIDNVAVYDWTFQTTNSFIEKRIELGESPTTVARRLATIKHFGRTLAERVSGYINPARGVRPPLSEQTKPNSLTTQELESLKETLKILYEHVGNNFNLYRNNFLLELLLATGLRADEVRLLTLGQLSEDLQFFQKVKTKGKKFRSVYLDSQIRINLEKYLAKREKYLIKNLENYRATTKEEKSKFPIFVSTRNASILNPKSLGLAPKTIWRVIADFGRKTNLLAETNKRISKIHPHKLRHTFAHEVLDSSKDIRLLAQILGHSSVTTTMVYTERTKDDIVNAIETKIQKKGKTICK
ncbi:MAG: tyrosine-type recombinase/integrase [Deltaproteobacteria bacterium]|jgi:integrase/recombinase XerC|nr:tyrosine-type recombinase/integrase [Deltaproteobacteria bacterium]